MNGQYCDSCMNVSRSLTILVPRALLTRGRLAGRGALAKSKSISLLIGQQNCIVLLPDVSKRTKILDENNIRLEILTRSAILTGF